MIWLPCFFPFACDIFLLLEKTWMLRDFSVSLLMNVKMTDTNQMHRNNEFQAN